MSNDHAQSGMERVRPIQSAVLSDVPHGFSTRTGGVSGGVFASLNFGNPGELTGPARDPVTNIAENLRRLREAIGAARRSVVEVYQVHGDGVHVYRRGEGVEATSRVRADALVTDDPGVVLCMRTADCAPVLMADGSGRVVAAVHAGWRGVIAGVAARAAEVMEREFSAPCRRAVIGPCIGADAFEVGAEVVEAFRAGFGEDPSVWRARSDGKGHVDLQRALRVQLERAGVAVVEACGGCTVSQPGLYFSHRRDRGVTGRMAALIGVRSGKELNA
ncbi:MAG: peptidoglycan editing factor PgeF [Phycisphaerales bacterium]